MKLFLVEDNEAILARLRCQVAELPGCAIVGEAAGEAAALAGIAAARPDIVVLDLVLGQGTGIGILRKLPPQERPAIAVLTSRSAAQYRDRCLALGADVFLDKARDFESLPQQLAALASRKKKT